MHNYGKKYFQVSPNFSDRLKKGILYVVFFIILVISICLSTRKYEEWKEDHTGIPDAVGSISENNDHYLIVVANSDKINDKEELSRKIIHMCQENSFKSIKFSVSVNGYPSKLDINVYLHRDDIEAGKVFCKIEYKTFDNNLAYDIKHNSDKYHLFLDGTEIDFY